ncbi:MAG: DUF1800 family protein [Candidatus Xenobia bacterium]
MKLTEICHLYRAAGFGPGPDDLQRGLAQGYEACVRDLLACDRELADLPKPPPTTLLPPGIKLGIVEVAALVDWWLKVMISTSRPLLEKMVLFWHGHFTTAGPLFLLGPVRGGFHGDHPSLTALDEGDLRHTVDFREIYAGLLESWLQTDSHAVLGKRFKALPLLAAA